MNVFDLLSAVDQVQQKIATMKPDIEKLQHETNADFWYKTVLAHGARAVLNHLINVGPPPSFAEGLKVTPEQATILYNQALRAAIERTTGNA